MRKINMLLLATSIACVAIASGCAEVNTDDPIKENVLSENIVVLQAIANENDTKGELSLDGGAFTWNTTDRIAVATSAGYKASAEAGVSGAKVAFSVDLGEATLNTNAFALYPHTLVMDAAGTVPLEDCNLSHDGDGDPLVVHLPDTYAIGDVTSPKVPCPMIASNVSEGTLEFKQLCAILCIKVNSIPASAKSLVFDFAGKKVSGKFEIAGPTPGTSSIVAGDNDSYDTITITGLDNDDWTDGLVINLPVPTGVASTNEFTTVKVTAKNGSSETVLEMTRPIKVGANWVPARANRLKIIASLPAFSVSDTKRVHIAKSNLQLSRPDMDKTWAEYQALGQLTWSFMENSWSRDTESDIALDHSNKQYVHSFAWGSTGHNFNAGLALENYVYGTYYQPWETAFKEERQGSDFGPKGSSTSLTGDFAYGDWGKKICEGGKTLNDGHGASSQWRLLTGEESLYLFGKTENPTFGKSTVDATGDAEEGTTCYEKRHNHWGMCRVNTDTAPVIGVFFVPDYFVNPTTVSVTGGSFRQEYNQFTAEQWALMEAAGAAFLPSSTRILRDAGTDRGITSNPNISYWTSTGRGDNTTHATAIDAAGNEGTLCKLAPASTGCNRRNGMAVRLVRDLN